MPSKRKKKSSTSSSLPFISSFSTSSLPSTSSSPSSSVIKERAVGQEGTKSTKTDRTLAQSKKKRKIETVEDELTVDNDTMDKTAHIDATGTDKEKEEAVSEPPVFNILAKKDNIPNQHALLPKKEGKKRRKARRKNKSQVGVVYAKHRQYLLY
eukprot:gb/GEZN01017419.1/.p1 GENE.gb/GEZN01017419.1/~~gb/GEZN01017419.1/.p1  ORF type:complete len:154 (+),score=45.96 gb/GEZN01017419.1/:132-593(+)